MQLSIRTFQFQAQLHLNFMKQSYNRKFSKQNNQTILIMFEITDATKSIEPLLQASELPSTVISP